MPATKTLPQCAHDTIESAIDEAADDDPVILWWDDGGYLRDIVEHASTQLRCEFRAAEQTPLELRADAPRDRTVWYVPQPSSDDVDWFRTSSTPEELSSSTSANSPPAASKTTASRPRRFAQPTRTPRAEARESPLARSRGRRRPREGRPDALRGTRWRGRPAVAPGPPDEDRAERPRRPDAVRPRTWNTKPPDGEGLLKIRDLLVDDGVTAVEGESDARTIVERTRRWAVAEWFVDEGLDKALLPQEYQPEPSTGFGVSGPNSGRC